MEGGPLTDRGRVEEEGEVLRIAPAALGGDRRILIFTPTPKNTAALAGASGVPHSHPLQTIFLYNAITIEIV